MTLMTSSLSDILTETSLNQTSRSVSDVANVQVGNIFPLFYTSQVIVKLMIPTNWVVGRHLARESVWLAIGAILATLNISKDKDENGTDIEPEDDQGSGIVS